MQDKENNAGKEIQRRRDSNRQTQRREELEHHFGLIRGTLLADRPLDEEVSQQVSELIRDLRHRQRWRLSLPQLLALRQQVISSNLARNQVVQILMQVYLSLDLDRPDAQLLREDVLILETLLPALYKLASTRIVAEMLVERRIEKKLMSILNFSKTVVEPELTWLLMTILLKLAHFAPFESRFAVFLDVEKYIEEIPKESGPFIEAITMAADSEYLREKTKQDVLGLLLAKVDLEPIALASEIFVNLGLPVFRKVVERWPALGHRIVGQLSNSNAIIKRRMVRLLENWSSIDDGSIFSDEVVARIFRAMKELRGYKSESMVLMTCINLLRNRVQLSLDTKIMLLRSMPSFRDQDEFDVSDYFLKIFKSLSSEDQHNCDRLKLFELLENDFPRDGVLVRTIAKAYRERE